MPFLLFALMLFTQARPLGVLTGQPKPVRATGRITGLPPGFPAELLRVVLLPIGQIETPATIKASSQSVRPDGSFTFPSLPAGSYSLLTVPALVARRGQIGVGDQDVELPDLVFQHSLWGRAVVEEGGDVPFMQAMAAVSTAPIRFLTFQISPTSTGRGGRPQAVSALVFENGLFMMHPTAGEYQLTRLETPLGYTVKSMTYGGVDLLQGLPFTIVDARKPTEIRITLSKKPPAGPLRKVSGRVDGASGEGAGWVEIQSAHEGIDVLRSLIGETAVRPDGSFEIENVPPGDYVMHFRKGFEPGLRIAVTVGAMDITGITLQTTSR